MHAPGITENDLEQNLLLPRNNYLHGELIVKSLKPHSETTCDLATNVMSMSKLVLCCIVHHICRLASRSNS